MGIPKQQLYTLVSISKFGMFETDPVKCDDCGRTVYNKAVIKGETDGKTYVIGLTCLKKLVTHTVTFSLEDIREVERQEYLFDQAERARRFVDRKIKEYGDDFKYLVVEYLKDDKFTVAGYGTRKFRHTIVDNALLFSAYSLDRKFLPFFKNLQYKEK